MATETDCQSQQTSVACCGQTIKGNPGCKDKVYSRSAVATAAAARPRPACSSRAPPLAAPTGMPPGMLLGLLAGRVLLVGPRGSVAPARGSMRELISPRGSCNRQGRPSHPARQTQRLADGTPAACRVGQGQHRTCVIHHPGDGPLLGRPGEVAASVLQAAQAGGASQQGCCRWRHNASALAAQAARAGREYRPLHPLHYSAR